MNWISNYVRPRINSLFSRREVPENLWTKCPECGTMLFHRELGDNLFVCTSCDHHMAITPRDRFGALFDGGAFVEVKVPEPTADPPTLLAALDAKLYLASVRGERCVSAGSFVKGPLETVRADDEILLRIEIPRGRQAVRYVRQLNGHRSLVGAAAFVPRQADTRPQVWLGCVAQRPVALPNTEAIVMGSGGVLDTDTLRKAIAADIAVLDAGDDEDVSAEYIRHVASVVIYRTAAAAAEAAGKKVGP